MKHLPAGGGSCPRPASPYITQSMRADAGIVVSASHNPFQDNGIKIFSGNGFQMSDEQKKRSSSLSSGKASRHGATCGWDGSRVPA